MSDTTGTLARPAEAAAAPGRSVLGALNPAPGRAARGPAAAAQRLGAVLAALGLGPAETQTLERLARTRIVPAGQCVFRRDDAAHALVLLLQGDVALGVGAAETDFRPERLLHAPAWLDLSSAWLDHGTHALDGRALTEVLVAELPREAVQPALDERPGLARHVITGLAREVRALTLNTHDLMHKDAPARLAAWLHERLGPEPAAAGGAGAPSVVQLTERKRDIASQLGITPETLSRLMRSFMRRGVIDVAGYTVRVLDPGALAGIARGDEPQVEPAA